MRAIVVGLLLAFSCASVDAAPAYYAFCHLYRGSQGDKPRNVLTYGELVAAIKAAHIPNQEAQITIFDKYVSENIYTPVQDFNATFGIIGSSTEHPAGRPQ